MFSVKFSQVLYMHYVILNPICLGKSFITPAYRVENILREISKFFKVLQLTNKYFGWDSDEDGHV